LTIYGPETPNKGNIMESVCYCVRI